jgi:hypothetical protein
MADLRDLPLDELSRLPDWLIPPDRKLDVLAFKAEQRREALYGPRQQGSTQPQTKPGERMEDPRGYWPSRTQSEIRGDALGPDSAAGSSSPRIKRGPRGGQYTDGVTKEGRPYRRYF